MSMRWHATPNLRPSPPSPPRTFGTCCMPIISCSALKMQSDDTSFKLGHNHAHDVKKYDQSPEQDVPDRPNDRSPPLHVYKNQDEESEKQNS